MPALAPTSLQLVPPSEPLSPRRAGPPAGGDGGGDTAVAARFAVRLDWHSPAVMVAVARAFAAFRHDDPVELVLVVGEAPRPEHAEQALVLMDAVAESDGRFAAVQVVGIDELRSLRVDGGTLQPPDDVRAGVELVAALDAMREVRATLRAASV